MKKKILFLIILVGVIASYFLRQKTQYVQFYPIFFNYEHDGLIINKTDTIDHFYENLEKVLSHYNEDYQKRGNTIYVKESLYNDLELCWNYTNKANDSVWMQRVE
jgi:hypothetical protein